MTYSNKSTVNFSGGEVAPGVVARTDLPLFNKVLARMENFYAEPQGPARYRSGSRYVHHTRQNKKARFIEFQYSDIQSYLIEVTEGWLRFYKDEGIIFKDSLQLTITGISQANPGVLTYVGTDPTNGQEVQISGVVGMTEVNGKFYTVAGVNGGANTFQLTDVFGNNVDTTGFAAYVSGGVAKVIYEVESPYLDIDFENVKYAQNADTMYLTNNRYEPRKMQRTAHDSWTLGRYSRTNDPFATENVTFGSITAITQANPGQISDAGHTFVVGDHVYITGIVGMTQLNNRHFLINTVGAGVYTLKDYFTGVAVNTTAYTAWASGGIVEKIGATKYPAACGFTDGARLGMGGSTGNPETMWFSRGPSAAGAVRFDDYTTGTAANDAVTFTLAPLQGQVDSIRWMTNTDKYIAAGNVSAVSARIFGDTEASTIAPDEINAKAANSDGVNPAAPVVDGSVIFYIGRSGLSVETLEYDYQVDGYAPDDKNLVTSHLTVGGLKQLARQIGRPTLIWAVRNDGVMLALTFKAKENIAGWHRHTIGGDGAVEYVGIMPRENNQDQLWMMVRRTINSQTVRYIEFLTDQPDYPVLLDYFTDDEEGDFNRFLNWQSEVVKDAIHVDASLTYDGSAYGSTAGANITLGAGAGTEDTEDVVVTASAAVFTASMVGREVWGAYDKDGAGGGRITITSYVSPTVVMGTVLDAFYRDDVQRWIVVSHRNRSIRARPSGRGNGSDYHRRRGFPIRTWWKTARSPFSNPPA
jgi:hypothetical protein